MQSIRIFRTAQVAKTIGQDNRHSQAASFTQARTHACVLARQLQDSQADIKQLMAEVSDWQIVASKTTAQLQHRDLEVLLRPAIIECHAVHLLKTKQVCLLHPQQAIAHLCAMTINMRMNLRAMALQMQLIVLQCKSYAHTSAMSYPQWCYTAKFASDWLHVMFAQVSKLQQQLAKVMSHSSLAPEKEQQVLPCKAAAPAPGAADDIGHLHAQVQGVETIIATLRALVAEQEQQLMQQELQLQQQQSQQQPPGQYTQAAIKMLKQQLKQANLKTQQATEQLEKHKEHSTQLKQDVHQQKLQLEQEEELRVQAQAEAASSQKAHGRLAQQLEQAQAELSQQGSELDAKVYAASLSRLCAVLLPTCCMAACICSHAAGACSVSHLHDMEKPL